MTFNRFTTEETTNFLANFLPGGIAFESKFVDNSNIRNLLKGQSKEFTRLNNLFNTHIEQLDPNTTTDYLEEWESAIKIPDSCIPLGSTDQERRDNIILKLASLSVQTEEDYKNLAEQFGFTIEFITDEFPPYDVPFFPSGSSGSLGGVPPYNVPFTPQNNDGDKFNFIITGDFNSNPTNADIFECLVKILSPSIYRVILISTT